jgi:hypothetical protein
MVLFKSSSRLFVVLTALLWSNMWSDAAVTDLKISEFMASNSATLKDEDGAYSDWIEIFNAGTTAVNVQGLRLTDDAANTAKWAFPSLNLGAGQYLVLFASSKNRVDPTKTLHTNFALGAGGEYLGLYNTDGSVLSEYSPQFPPQTPDVSYGINSAGLLRYFSAPTPGTANGVGDNPAMPVTANYDRGFYSAPIAVTLATTQPGGQIRYTLDGSEPTSSSTLYTAPIQVSTTTVLRAMTTASGFQNSPTKTLSYIFLNDVIQQPATIPGFPNGRLSDTGAVTTQVPMDMAMDPAVVSSYSSEIINSMKAIPTMSLVSSLADIFGSNGFYFSGGDDVERKVSIEVLYADGTSEQIDGGAEAHSHDRLKRSIRLNFRSEYGSREWTTNIIRNGPIGSSAITNKHRTLILRGGNNRCWARTWNPDATAYTEDEFYRKSFAAVTGAGSQGTFVHLYINGVYWGLYNLVERPDDDFAAEYFGGDDDFWFFTNHGGAGSKDPTRWNYLTGTLASKDMSVAANYEEMKRYLDVQHFADYLIVSFWVGLTDWPSNNWYVVLRNDGAAEGPAPAKFMAWDGEWSLDRRRESGQGANIPSAFKTDTGSSTPIVKLWFSLLKSTEFRNLFADRVALHTGTNGPLTDAAAIARWDALNNFIRSAVVGESARWGDSLKSLGGSYAVTRTRDVDWQNEVTIIRNLLNGNRQKLINVLVSAGLYTNLEPPTFSPNGGPIAAGGSVQILNPNGSGTIKYTLDGSDPRTTSSATYTSPIAVTNSVVIKAAISGGGAYSAVVTATFPVLVVTEVHYNPGALSAGETAAGFTDPQDFEFIELRNIGPNPVNLNGFVFTQGLTLPTNQTLITVNPGEYFVFVSNINAFRQRYGNTPKVAGVYTGSNLSNGGERIAAEHPLGVVLFDFTYDDIAPWPVQPDGQGPSLEVINSLGNLNDPANWRASTLTGGTPGRASDGSTPAPVQAPVPAPTKAPTAATSAPVRPPTKAPVVSTAAPVSPPSPTSTVLTLVNANTDIDIVRMSDGMTINLLAVGSSLNIRADPSVAGVKSVVFFYDGLKFRTENSAIYAFAGNSGSDYYSWTPTVGSHTVTATSYSATGGTGTVLSSVTVRFTVVSTTGTTPTTAPVKSPTATAAPVKSPTATAAPVRPPTSAPVTPPTPTATPPTATTFTLINANTDLDIGPLTNGMTVRLGTVGTALNVRANPQVSGVKSVVFFYDGVKFRTESSAPYALAGDNSGNYNSWTPSLGTHTLTATSYSGTGGTGTVLDNTSISFTVTQTRRLRSAGM